MEITFCTFNIRHDNPGDGADRWSFRRDLVCDLWLKHAWDIVGLQEAFESQIADVLRSLPHYDYVGVGREDGVHGGEHCPIFYRTDRFTAVDSGTFWLSDTPTVPGSATWGNRHPRICTWARLRAVDGAGLPASTSAVDSEAGFSVYNTHTDHESQEARENSSDQLLKSMAARSGRNVILMGDFNANVDNPAIRSLLNGTPSLVDTHSLRGSEEYSFHGFTGRNLDGKIDYIFASPDWEVVDSRIVDEHREGRYPSDHFPVMAKLKTAE